MCEIDDRADKKWSQEELKLTEQEAALIHNHITESAKLPSDEEMEEMKRILDGILDLPSETERVLREMEAEKRGER